MNSRLLRMLHFSPSLSTGRHDSYRATLGIGWFLGETLREHHLPHRWELVWALPTITEKARVHAVLADADLLVVGTPTHGQGSPWFVRKFFEMSAGTALWGRPATAFATAGGQHTGGEQAVADTLRSLQGLGAATFSFAQKMLVFGTNQKLAADGVFDFVDAWFMQQFARTLVLHLVVRDAPDAADEWAARLSLETGYYNNFPSRPDLELSFGKILVLLNAPLEMGLAGYAEWTAQFGFDCTPPAADALDFHALLPQ